MLLLERAIQLVETAGLHGELEKSMLRKKIENQLQELKILKEKSLNAQLSLTLEETGSRNQGGRCVPSKHISCKEEHLSRRPRTPKPFFETSFIFSNCISWVDSQEAFALVQVNKACSKDIPQAMLQISPFVEMKAFFDFQNCILKLEVSKRAETWLNYNSKLKIFREKNILAEEKTLVTCNLLEKLVQNTECNYGFKAYCWPKAFRPHSVLSVLDSIKVLSCKWSTSACSMDYHYQSFFQIQNYVFSCRIELYYEDIYQNFIAQNVSNPNDLHLESYQIIFRNSQQSCENNALSLDLMKFKFSDEDETGMYGHFLLDALLKVAKNIHSDMEPKFFLHLLFILSMPEDGKLFHSFETEPAFDGATMWEIWDTKFWKLLQDCLLKNTSWRR